MLTELTSANYLAALQPEERMGFALHVYRLNPADLSRFRELQEMKRHRSPDWQKERHGTLTTSTRRPRVA